MIVDVTGIILTPGDNGKYCLGNGTSDFIECCCDECDYAICYLENACLNCDDKADCPKQKQAPPI